MARPEKNGLEYFPMDVDTGENFKIELIEAKFGLEGFALLIKLYMKIYRNWYFLKYTEDYGMIFARKSGMSFERFSEILDYFLEKDLFDRELFLHYSILTSPTIQRRWLKGCEKRAKIRIIEEYWLIDETTIFEGDKLLKLTFINSFGVSSGSLVEETPQSKVEESKVKETRLEGEREQKKEALPPPPPINAPEEEKKSEGAEIIPWIRDEIFTPPTVQEIDKYIRTLGFKSYIAEIEADKIFNYYDMVGWKAGGMPVLKWQPLVKRWMNNDFQRKEKKTAIAKQMEIGKTPEPKPDPEREREIEYENLIANAEADIKNMSYWTTLWEQAAEEKNVEVEKLLDACSLRKYLGYKKSIANREDELRKLLEDFNNILAAKASD